MKQILNGGFWVCVQLSLLHPQSLQQLPVESVSTYPRERYQQSWISEHDDAFRMVKILHAQLNKYTSGKSSIECRGRRDQRRSNRFSQSYGVDAKPVRNGSVSFAFWLSRPDATFCQFSVFEFPFVEFYLQGCKASSLSVLQTDRNYRSPLTRRGFLFWVEHKRTTN